MRKLDVRLLMPCALLVTILLASALNGSASACYGVNADQQSSETAAARLFLGEVARIDLTAYNASFSWQAEPSVITSYLYPGGHTQTIVKAQLVNANGNFDVEVHFLDGEFLSYSLYSNSAGGTLATKSHFASAVDVARFTLERYSANFNASYCDKLENLLGGISQTKSEQEIGANYASLLFTPTEMEGENFVWRFVMNNAVSAQKSVGLGVDVQNGQNLLSYFGDHWRHYKIENATVNVSRDEAINTALGILNMNPDTMNLSDANQKDDVRIIQSQFHEEGAKTVGTQATLEFNSNPGGDCLILYPAWHVSFSYDKTYSYYSYGFEVRIWADSGQIFAVDTLGTMGGSGPTGTPNPSDPVIYWLAVAALALSVAITALTFHRKRKHQK